jgi:cinnamoyl-CoA:phenyllactate CoA-transferase
MAVPAYDLGYKNFITAIGHPELADSPKFYPQAALQANRLEFYEEVMTPTFASKTAKEWAEILTKADVPHAIASTWDEVLNDQQAWENNWLYKMQYPTGNTRTMVRMPVSFLDSPPPDYPRGPYLGEHTEKVLAEIGYSEAEIKTMLEQGAAAHPPMRPTYK